MNFRFFAWLFLTRLWWAALCSSLLLGSCKVFSAYEYPQLAAPVSRHPTYSELTDLPINPEKTLPNSRLNPFDGYPDNQVLAPHSMDDTTKYRPYPLDLHGAFGIATATDTVGRKLYRPSHLPAGLDKIYFNSFSHQPFEAPGVVWLFDIGLLIDEIEVPNIEWQTFTNYVERESGQAVATSYFPSTTSLPTATYFTDPYYRYYPVVGVSREQVEAYCRWRSAVTTEALRITRNLSLTHTDYMVMRYRLPTETEWEYAAGTNILPNKPYGVLRPNNRLRINPRAADYLRIRSKSDKSAAEIKRDIVAFNSASPEITQFNCQREAPYFLALPTPGYVFDLPQNFFGLYQMNGNAAEMVQEPGLTKGGSYRDPLEACTIKARGAYAGPSPTVGFRCVCEISFPNRK